MQGPYGCWILVPCPTCGRELLPVAPGCLLKPHTQGQAPPQRVTAAFNAEGRHDAMRTSFHKGQEMTRDPDAKLTRKPPLGPSPAGLGLQVSVSPSSLETKGRILQRCGMGRPRRISLRPCTK